MKYQRCCRLVSGAALLPRATCCAVRLVFKRTCLSAQPVVIMCVCARAHVCVGLNRLNVYIYMCVCVCVCVYVCVCVCECMCLCVCVCVCVMFIFWRTSCREPTQSGSLLSFSLFDTPGVRQGLVHVCRVRQLHILPTPSVHVQ